MAKKESAETDAEPDQLGADIRLGAPRQQLVELLPRAPRCWNPLASHECTSSSNLQHS